MTGDPQPFLARLASHARDWGATLDHSFETPTSVIAYGRRGTDRVVLKVVKQPGDEWRAGEVTRAFGGRGMVRVLEYADGASLLECLDPASPLADLVHRGDDEAATVILCDVIDAMASRNLATRCPTVRDWARGFDRYATSADTPISRDLVALGERLFLGLCESQAQTRLLHGDLQHYNVVYDRDRAWVAIDPKGVVGELEYEIGAALRNPTERPDVFANRATVERRLATFTARLNLDAERALRWGFAQAVLSAVWSVEDGHRVDATTPALMLAATLRPMIGDDR